jgi:hypothetical protein
MRNSILSGWQNLFGRGQAKPETNEEPTHEERFRQIYQEELRYVKQNPKFVAHIFAQDRIDQENRQREAEFAERQERTERLMQSCGKNYAPVLESHRERDEPDLEPE